MIAARAVPARPVVLIAVGHPVLCRLIFELLDRDHGCWDACLLKGTLATAMTALDPDVVVIDGGGPVGWRREQIRGFPAARIVVIGAVSDPAYRAAALRHGAGGWVASDDIAEQLPAALRSALACIRGPSSTSPTAANPAP